MSFIKDNELDLPAFLRRIAEVLPTMTEKKGTGILATDYGDPLYCCLGVGACLLRDEAPEYLDKMGFAVVWDKDRLVFTENSLPKLPEGLAGVRGIDGNSATLRFVKENVGGKDQIPFPATWQEHLYTLNDNNGPEAWREEGVVVNQLLEYADRAEAHFANGGSYGTLV